MPPPDFRSRPRCGGRPALRPRPPRTGSCRSPGSRARSRPTASGRHTQASGPTRPRSLQARPGPAHRGALLARAVFRPTSCGLDLLPDAVVDLPSGNVPIDVGLRLLERGRIAEMEALHERRVDSLQVDLRVGVAVVVVVKEPAPRPRSRPGVNELVSMAVVLRVLGEHEATHPRKPTFLGLRIDDVE